ncbi:MAG: hypothetical protein QM765_05070 [Myxococcales bacterium]
MRKLFFFSLAVALVAAGVLVGCQGYQFDEVVPSAATMTKQRVPILGEQKSPKIMLVIDRSGSMKTLADNDAVWGCAETDGSKYYADRKCKWNTLRDLLTDDGGFLDQIADNPDPKTKNARLGLAMFANPSGDACAAGTIAPAVSDVAGGNLVEIKAKLRGETPSGGTPSAATLVNVGSDPNFTKKEDATKNYVILVTDGQPNCNASISKCEYCTNLGGDPAKMCDNPRNCMDDVALTKAVQTLKAKEIDTFVIGFGSAIDNEVAKKALNAAAAAGGQIATDPDPKYADVKFFLALDKDKLQLVLDKIRTRIQEPCQYTLNPAPASWDQVEVSVTDVANKQDIPLKGPSSVTATDGDWNFDGSINAITVVNPWCQKLTEAKADTYVVNFTSIKKL